jgi:hypothetical protein
VRKEEREVRWGSSSEEDDGTIRMMMIDENNDVNDPDRMNVSHTRGERRCKETMLVWKG